MSWQYESLKTTSRLPDLVTEADLNAYWLLEMGGVHGKEPRSVEIVEEHQAGLYCPQGVLSIVANHAAVEANVRSIGKLQLMACFPGDFDGATNEDRTAAGITWLASKLNPQHIIADWHTNPLGYSYIACGERVPAAALAVGHLLGNMSTIQCNRWSRFYKSLPRAVGIEDGATHTPESELARRQQIGSTLAEIIRLGPKELSELYFAEIADKVRFTETVGEILLADPYSRQPNESVLAVLDELEALELPDSSEREINLSDRAVQVLGLDNTKQYSVIAGGYHNMSPEIDNTVLKKSDDRQRLLCWGVLQTKAQPPVPEKGSDMLVFKPA